MPRHAGFSANVLIYTWRVQPEAEEIVSGYAEHKHLCYGSFHYSVEALD